MIRWYHFAFAVFLISCNAEEQGQNNNSDVQTSDVSSPGYSKDKETVDSQLNLLPLTPPDYAEYCESLGRIYAINNLMQTGEGKAYLHDRLLDYQNKVMQARGSSFIAAVTKKYADTENLLQEVNKAVYRKFKFDDIAQSTYRIIKDDVLTDGREIVISVQYTLRDNKFFGDDYYSAEGTIEVSYTLTCENDTFLRINKNVSVTPIGNVPLR